MAHRRVRGGEEDWRREDSVRGGGRVEEEASVERDVPSSEHSTGPGIRRSLWGS